MSHYRTYPKSKNTIPDLQTLIQHVVQIFQLGHLSLTLFVTSSDMPYTNGIVVNKVNEYTLLRCRWILCTMPSAECGWC